MALKPELFKAILAMDAYNRGYDAGIDLPNSIGSKIGNASVIRTRGEDDAEAIGFYAIAYQLAGGEKVISIRGTDNKDVLSKDIFKTDVWNGWGVALGSPEGKQAGMVRSGFS
ncbi:MAG: hypothetical protein DI586_06160 [Micavibrio aeruginosavorus]|uniref:Uncharacterized protein n=1 Tax=Micavibrio aeruginosavorus TaxID=349221 RepID=A0A2W5FMP0_9BACT|nr:MAG: hypothetical protein DI586_06160 [Micavibrio aeruginosavorus]